MGEALNLLTWRKVSPVFYRKTELFILAHDKLLLLSNFTNACQKLTIKLRIASTK